MSQLPLYPLRFEPIFQTRIWGGRRLADLFGTTLLNDGPIGEAWILSDRDDHPSRIANGPLKGRTIAHLIELAPEELLGKMATRFRRFPLLLKFLDAETMLSVQVHPSDAQPSLIPAGETPKTEAWVVLEAHQGSRVYAGLTPGTTAKNIEQALKSGNVTEHLACFTPKAGDAFFIPAGMVHSVGGATVVFEVQQNSDVTYRLYDWGHVDAKTGEPRPLQIEEALECINLARVGAGPVTPVVEEISPVEREKLFDSDHFVLWRLRGRVPFTIGATGAPRVVVCVDGAGHIQYELCTLEARKGDVFLLPAMVGICEFRPRGAVNLLEIAIPGTDSDVARDLPDGGDTKTH